MKTIKASQIQSYYKFERSKLIDPQIKNSIECSKSTKEALGHLSSSKLDFIIATIRRWNLYYEYLKDANTEILNLDSGVVKDALLEEAAVLALASDKVRSKTSALTISPPSNSASASGPNSGKLGISSYDALFNSLKIEELTNLDASTHDMQSLIDPPVPYLDTYESLTSDTKQMFDSAPTKPSTGALICKTLLSIEVKEILLPGYIIATNLTKKDNLIAINPELESNEVDFYQRMFIGWMDYYETLVQEHLYLFNSGGLELRSQLNLENDLLWALKEKIDEFNVVDKVIPYFANGESLQIRISRGKSIITIQRNILVNDRKANLSWIDIIDEKVA